MLQKYFTSSYLFGPYTVNMGRSELLFAYFAVLVVIAGVALYLLRWKIRDRLQKYLLSRWYTLLLNVGILVLLWTGLRYEYVQYLDANIVPITIYILGIIWAIYILRYQMSDYKNERQRLLKEQLKRKYY